MWDLIKHCSKNKHHRDRSEDEYTKPVLALTPETPAEYPIPLQLSVLRVSFREATPARLIAIRLYYFCRGKDLPAQVRLTPILAIHLTPFIDSSLMYFHNYR